MAGTIEIRHADKIGSVLLIGFSIAIYLLAGWIPLGRTPEHDPGPAFFPRLVAIGIGFLATVQLVAMIYRGDGIHHEVPTDRVKSVVLVAAALVAYVLAMQYLGFLLASFLFLVALLVYSGESNPRIIALIAIGFPFGLYFVFAGIFNVPLPDNAFFRWERFLPFMVWIEVPGGGIR